MGILNTHMLTHTGQSQIHVKFVESIFLTDNTIKVHMVTHIGKNIHKKYFTTIINLNRYLLTHPRKKPYPCELCDKTFLRNYDWLFILFKKS